MKLRWIGLSLALLLLSANLAFGQLTFQTLPLGFPQIAIGGDAGGQNYVTIIQLVNNNSSSITGHFTLISDAGTALPALFDGQGPQSTLDVTLQPGATRQIQLTLNGPITTGWLNVSYTPSNALTTVILQFRSGTTLLSEVGVDPAFEPLSGTDFAAETDVTLNTGIAIANPSNVQAFVLARLWDPSTGTSNTSTILTLPGGGHVAKLLTELFPNVLNIAQIRAQISLDSCSTSTCQFAGGNGFLATAIRLNGDQFTTIPLSERAPDGEQIRIMPQVAFGGPAAGLNMKTVLYLTTNVTTGVFGTGEIFDDNGAPLAASADGGAPSPTFNFTVSGHRVTRVVLSGDQVLRSGWMRLTLPSTVNLIASAVFQTFTGSNLVSEASVLDSAEIEHGLIYVKVNNGGANVGVAFANSQSSANTIVVDLFNGNGSFSESSEITLPPNGHLARFVTELFPKLVSSPDFDGALSVRSSTHFTALALRLNSDKLATLPVAPNGMYRPAITGMRVTRTQRSHSSVTFELDVADTDSNMATTASTSIFAVALVDFGSNIFDVGAVTIDGTNMVGRSTGTITATFVLPSITSGIPSGRTADLYVIVYDALENESNLVGLRFRF